jgi:acyl dehydratase
MNIGDRISWRRTFTEEDVRRFNQMSGDQGIHHVAPDKDGRLMVHGLLTATIPTKIGGDMNFIDEVSVSPAGLFGRYG